MIRKQEQKSKPNTERSGRRIRSFSKRFLALSTAALVCFGYISKPESSIRVDADETSKVDAIDVCKYYEWTGVEDVMGTFNKSKNTTYRVMVTWNHEGTNYYITGTGNLKNKYWYPSVNIDTDRQVHYYETRWLTDNGRGAPYFVCNGTRDKDNDYYPQVTIYKGATDASTAKDSAGNVITVYKERNAQIRVTADDDDLEFKNSEHANAGGVQWTVEKRGMDHGVGGVNIFQNVTFRDPVWKKEGYGINAHYQTTESKRHWFYLYTGKEVQFNRYPAGIRCYSGQVTALKVNSILPEGTVTTILPGSVLTINSKTFLNGKIEVDGGTLVIQEGATLMTYSRNNAKEYAGSIEVKNGGSVIVMNKGILSLGRLNPTSTSCSNAGQLKLTSGGKLYNFGTTICNQLVMNDSAEIENRKGGVLYAGYQFTDIGNARLYFNQNWQTNDTRFAATGTGGCLISAAPSKVVSMTDQNLRVVNKGTIYLSSGYQSQSGFAGLVKGNAVNYSRRALTTLCETF